MTPTDPNPSLRRKDMITALKAKDTNRLNVLRALLSDTTNAEKSSRPIKTDLEFLSLVKKRIVASKAAAMEFGEAKRDDLKSREEEQVQVLEQYAGSVHVLSEEEIRRVVERAVKSLKESEAGKNRKVDVAVVLRTLLDEGGELKGRPVERGVLVGIVRRVLGEGAK